MKVLHNRGEAAVGVICVVCLAACSGNSEEDFVRVLFRGEQNALQGYVHDTGYKPATSAVQIRVQVSPEGKLKGEAWANAEGPEGPLHPILDAGTFSMDVRFKLKLTLRINLAGVKFTGPVKGSTTPTLTFTGEKSFSPFLLGDKTTLSASIPKTLVATIPLDGQVSGAKGDLVIKMGGKLTSELHGVCARAAAGLAGYTARTGTSGQLTISPSAKLQIKGQTRTIPAFDIPVQIPTHWAHLDLGSSPVAEGVAPGKGPCFAQRDAGGVDGRVDATPDSAPRPDTASCSSSGGKARGSLCKVPSDCACPGVCLKVFTDAPGSCWPRCDPTMTDPVTGKNPACKNSGYGEACQGGCLPLGPITGTFNVPVYSPNMSPSTVDELGSAAIQMGSMSFQRGWGSRLAAGSAFTHTLVLYGSVGRSVDQTQVLQILFPKTSTYKANQSYNLAKSGQVELRYLVLTLNGSKVTAKRLRGYSWDGTLNLSAAGSGNKDVAKGSLTGRLASYETELCGPATSGCN